MRTFIQIIMWANIVGVALGILIVMLTKQYPRTIIRYAWSDALQIAIGVFMACWAYMLLE